jgi:hypothetical protein
MFFGDFSEYLRKVAESQSGSEVVENNYQNFKALATPSWVEVTQKSEAVKWAHSFASSVANHVMTCTDPQCPYNNTLVSFMTPSLFIKIILVTLEKYHESAPEAKDLADLWRARSEDPESLERLVWDPRYIAFRCAFDMFMVNIAVFRETVKDPYRNLNITIE